MQQPIVAVARTSGSAIFMAGCRVYAASAQRDRNAKESPGETPGRVSSLSQEATAMLGARNAGRTSLTAGVLCVKRAGDSPAMPQP